ncbi:mechanosensitive ion channel family protein [Simiduia agarivorans]|uniref:Small-conductance mechanosensitive channel n=1 Tax=Simiduia agarivorans (strain DSM 21679 / JCM 13881 / BCRC 17597 / SA1) TaxID=1117647 RepID=K4KKM3_SIMAS|nr:mechanosensitive ion channel family protein [Simiduia agarivorans]AFU99571.2 hypothetical protein M5M_12000 [Simiduia agarivorans SA1 = DSM 21679]
MEKELEQINQVYNLATEFLVNYSFQILGAIVILIIGLVIAGKLAKITSNLCERRGIDVTLSRFIGSSVRIIVVAMVAIVALGKLGISVTPFVAAIGALTFGVSLAAQGLISNYGAGFNIIIGRPFVVGDTISVCGVSGQVTEVKLGQTRLINEDKVIITIPNKHIIGEILHNSHGCTLVEASIGVAYDSDMDQVMGLIRQAITGVEGVVDGEQATIGIEDFGDSSINVGFRYKVETAQLFQTRYAVNHAIYEAFKGAGVQIPFPQREVRLLNTATD